MTPSIIEQLKEEVFGKPAPEGWFSSSYIENALGISPQAVSRLAKKKNWPMQLFSSKTPDGRNIKAKHYKV